MMLNSTANMYPWYRDSMTQLSQYCGAAAAANNLGASIKTENGYNDCMLALDYAQNKVRSVHDDLCGIIVIHGTSRGGGICYTLPLADLASTPF